MSQGPCYRSGDILSSSQGKDMNIEAQIRKAQALRKMHDRPNILVLPNAWDAVTALVFARLGFAAIATTSGGVAHEVVIFTPPLVIGEHQLDAAAAAFRDVLDPAKRAK